MTKKCKYNVAGIGFTINLPAGYDENEVLAPYIPFKDEEVEAVFSLEIKFAELEIGGDLVEIFNDEPPYLWLLKGGNNCLSNSYEYYFGFSLNREKAACLLFVSDDFTRAELRLRENPSVHKLEFVISNAMMLLYTLNSNGRNTLLVHAAVNEYEGKGYMFLGRSGTGKSTHTRLWREHLQGVTMLNDDNPVVYVRDGRVMVSGSPWSGKTLCYINRQMPLGAVVRLSQAPYNKITPLSPLHGFAALLPSCSCLRWDEKSNGRLQKTVEKVVMNVPCYSLECLPDGAAAHLCFDTVVK
ncbi:MAG: hypothetical protein ACI3ZQ_07705 [Candidatus Cryptobacteroides sp.]